MQEEYPVSVEWKAFDLRPGTPPEGVARPDTPDQRAGQPLGGHAGQAAREAGLLMRRSGLIPRTRPAMEATEYAKERGQFDAFHRALFKAYWEEGKDLGDLATLLQEAERVGLDGPGLGRALQENRYTGLVEEQVQFARQAGITGIPAFIVDRYLFTGAQPYSFFKQVMERVLEERGAGS